MGKRRLGVKNELLDGIIEAGRRGDQGVVGLPACAMATSSLEDCDG